MSIFEEGSNLGLFLYAEKHIKEFLSYVNCLTEIKPSTQDISMMWHVACECQLRVYETLVTCHIRQYLYGSQNKKLPFALN